MNRQLSLRWSDFRISGDDHRAQIALDSIIFGNGRISDQLAELYQRARRSGEPGEEGSKRPFGASYRIAQAYRELLADSLFRVQHRIKANAETKRADAETKRLVEKLTFEELKRITGGVQLERYSFRHLGPTRGVAGIYGLVRLGAGAHKSVLEPLLEEASAAAGLITDTTSRFEVLPGPSQSDFERAILNLKDDGYVF